MSVIDVRKAGKNILHVIFFVHSPNFTRPLNMKQHVMLLSYILQKTASVKKHTVLYTSCHMTWFYCLFHRQSLHYRQYNIRNWNIVFNEPKNIHWVVQLREALCASAYNRHYAIFSCSKFWFAGSNPTQT